MFTLDSDFLGILLAIFTFLLPAISALFERKRKKEKGAEDNLPDDMAQEDMFTFVLGDEIAPQSQDAWDSIVEDLPETAAQEPVKEPEPVEHVQPAQDVQPVETDLLPTGKKVEEVVPQESCKPRKSLKERIKENPEDMILFSEILKPKFKEY